MLHHLYRVALCAVLFVAGSGVTLGATDVHELERVLRDPGVIQLMLRSPCLTSDVAMVDRAVAAEEQIIYPLVELLFSPHVEWWGHEEIAAYLLGELGGSRATRALLEYVRQSSGDEWYGMYNAILALGGLRHPQALPVLEQVLTRRLHAYSPSTRYEALADYGLHFAARRAIYQLTGDWRHFPGEEVFNPPVIEPTTLDLSTTLQGEGVVQGGHWEEDRWAVVGSCEGVGRLWLPWLLPSKYTLSMTVELDSGTAGISYGHLKDFLPLDPPTPVAYEFTMWVTPTDFGAEAWQVRTDYKGGLLDSGDLRSLLVRTRADLERRVALIVEGGTARFSNIRVREGLLVFKDTHYVIDESGRWHELFSEVSEQEYRSEACEAAGQDRN